MSVYLTLVTCARVSILKGFTAARGMFAGCCGMLGETLPVGVVGGEVD